MIVGRSGFSDATSSDVIFARFYYMSSILTRSLRDYDRHEAFYRLEPLGTACIYKEPENEQSVA